MDRVLDCLAQVATLISASRPYEYLLTKPIEEFTRLPKPLDVRVEQTGGFLRKKEHNVAKFANPLPEKLIRQYGLVPLSSHDPAVFKAAYHRFKREATKGFAKNRGQFKIENSKNSNIIAWEDNFDVQHPHVIVTYNSAGRVLESEEFRTADEAVMELWGYVPAKRRQAYAHRAIFAGSRS